MPETCTSRRTGEIMTRRHIWIADDDWLWLKETFEDQIGTSAAVQRIIRAFRKNAEAKVAAKVAGRPRAEGGL